MVNKPKKGLSRAFPLEALIVPDRAAKESDMDYKALGRRIRQYRTARNMRQHELAKKAGISLSFYGHIERGTRKPSLETMLSLAVALGAPMDALVRGVEPATREGAERQSLIAHFSYLKNEMVEIERILLEQQIETGPDDARAFRQ